MHSKNQPVSHEPTYPKRQFLLEKLVYKGNTGSVQYGLSLQFITRNNPRINFQSSCFVPMP